MDGRYSVRQINLIQWEVIKYYESNSAYPEKIYIVTQKGPQRWSCNCPSYRPLCKHMDMVEEYEAVGGNAEVIRRVKEEVNDAKCLLLQSTVV